MSYVCPEGEKVETSMALEEGQIPQYYSMAFNTEDPTYLDFFNPGELIPGTEVEVNIRVWRNTSICFKAFVGVTAFYAGTVALEIS